MRLQELAGCKEGVRATLRAEAVRGWELRAFLGLGGSGSLELPNVGGTRSGVG